MNSIKHKKYHHSHNTKQVHPRIDPIQAVSMTARPIQKSSLCDTDDEQLSVLALRVKARASQQAKDQLWLHKMYLLRHAHPTAVWCRCVVFPIDRNGLADCSSRPGFAAPRPEPDLSTATPNYVSIPEPPKRARHSETAAATASARRSAFTALTAQTHRDCSASIQIEATPLKNSSRRVVSRPSVHHVAPRDVVLRSYVSSASTARAGSTHDDDVTPAAASPQRTSSSSPVNIIDDVYFRVAAPVQSLVATCVHIPAPIVQRSSRVWLSRVSV